MYPVAAHLTSPYLSLRFTLAVSHSKSAMTAKLGRPLAMLARFLAASHSYFTVIVYVHYE